MLEVTTPQYGELTEDEQANASNNRSGNKYAGYIRITYNGETILLVSDAMEREDATFSRDLSWIVDALYKCYELGKIDGEYDL